MIEQLFDKINKDPELREQMKERIQEIEVPAKTILLREGEISKNIYFIKKGCLRLWFNNDGKDVTFQFFFENQAVSSFESFLGAEPSLFTLESIEHSELLLLSKKGFDILNQDSEFKDDFQKILIKRFKDYAKLFLSRIKDKPKARYDDLLKNSPEIIQRVPQHYIASFLGITPISLSRIRNRK